MVDKKKKKNLDLDTCKHPTKKQEETYLQNKERIEKHWKAVKAGKLKDAVDLYEDRVGKFDEDEFNEER